MKTTELNKTIRAGRVASGLGLRRYSDAAFSLIEVMVAIGLLTFIIVGLLMMFQQTQRAFRTGMNQTDLLEGGRSLMEMIRTELQQTTPTRYPGVPDLGVNFLTELSTNFVNPLIQDMPGVQTPRPKRTNVVQRMFFMTKQNQDWIGVGYEVQFNDLNGFVGSLYRYTATNSSRRGPFPLAGWIWTNTATKIADGVVHFRVRPCAQNGFPVYWQPGSTLLGIGANRYPADYHTNTFYTGALTVNQAWVVPNAAAPDLYRQTAFYRDALPAAVELELGILEQRTYQRYKALPVLPGTATPYETPGYRFLNDRAAQTHIFRERISLPNADLSVYQ